jgi:hypothetical protein
MGTVDAELSGLKMVGAVFLECHLDCQFPIATRSSRQGSSASALAPLLI